MMYYNWVLSGEECDQQWEYNEWNGVSGIRTNEWAKGHHNIRTQHHLVESHLMSC